MENGRIWRETCDSIICCNQNEIEDGYHHILKCKLYNNVWKEYIDLEKTALKFGLLIKTKNEIKLNKIWRFIKVINKAVCSPN